MGYVIPPPRQKETTTTTATQCDPAYPGQEEQKGKKEKKMSSWYAILILYNCIFKLCELPI